MKRMKHPLPRTSAIAVAAYAVLLTAVWLCLGGCIVIQGATPEGTRFSVLRVGSTSMEGLDVSRDADGFRLGVTGYQSDGAAVTEAAMRGAMQGLRGVAE